MLELGRTIMNIQVGPEVFLKKTLSRALRVRAKSDKIARSPPPKSGSQRSRSRSANPSISHLNSICTQ